MRGAGERRRRVRIGWTAPLGAIACITISALWSFAPLDPAPVEVPQIATESNESTVTAPELTLEPFQAPLWIVQAPPKLPPAPAPPPPLKLQLIAIVRENGVQKAAIYDPDHDRLALVAEGESVSGRTVESISAGSVAILDAGRIQRLALEAGGAR